jgi:translation initiation factor IF-3
VYTFNKTYNKNYNKTPRVRVNRNIFAREVRLIDSDGTQIGIVNINEALRMAYDKNLDLVEIAPTARPPVCKIIDYGKYKYQEKKKEQEAKKHRSIILLKEITLTPKTDDHDLDFKIRHIERFLSEGNKAKVSIKFKGREMAHQNLGRDLMKKIIDKIATIAIVDQAPKMDGRTLSAIFAPAKQQSTQTNINNPNREDTHAKNEDKKELSKAN